MSAARFMVCKACLNKFWGGWSKCCSHGWDLLAGKPVTGPCSECGAIVDDLNCPDGVRTVQKRIGGPAEGT